MWYDATVRVLHAYSAEELRHLAREASHEAHRNLWHGHGAPDAVRVTVLHSAGYAAWLGLPAVLHDLPGLRDPVMHYFVLNG